MDEAGTDRDVVRVLLVAKQGTVRDGISEKLGSYYPERADILMFSTVTEAIESLESAPREFHLALLEQEGQGVILLKAILGILGGAVAGVITNHPESLASLSAQERQVEVLDPEELLSGLYRLLKRSATLGRLPPPKLNEREEFVSIGMESLSGLAPLQSDVYARIRKDHYVCVFKKGSILEPADLKKFIDSKRTEFHVKSSEIKETLIQVADRLEDAGRADEVPLEKARSEFVSTHTLLRDVVGQLGFTDEAQKIAKSCVSMALKALGSKPKLTEILEDLRRKEGAYIPAHSFMVGNVACALAHRVGWSSSATFFKLSLAGFLHDISLNSEAHARIRDLEHAIRSGLEGEEIKFIKLHPARASEYSKQFAEIPSDVDIILSQHHENPRGNGFPRGMPGKLISPLSALFIMAQDLVHAVLDDPNLQYEDFFRTHSADYDVGQFKKILALILN